jgi:UDP-N-acetyl-D-mannosaminuronate dehydrogenase
MRHKISVVGLGYVGLPLAIELSKSGKSILGFDVDKQRIQRLQ